MPGGRVFCTGILLFSRGRAGVLAEYTLRPSNASMLRCFTPGSSSGGGQQENKAARGDLSTAPMLPASRTETGKGG